jgi:hypothetical protein
MDYLHSTLAGKSANPSKSFFLCSLRFLLLIHSPFKDNDFRFRIEEAGIAKFLSSNQQSTINNPQSTIHNLQSSIFNPTDSPPPARASPSPRADKSPSS